MVRVLLEVSKNSGVSLHSRYADQCAMPNHSLAVRHIPHKGRMIGGNRSPNVCDCSTCYARFQK